MCIYIMVVTKEKDKCFKSGNISTPQGGQFHLNFVAVPKNFYAKSIPLLTIAHMFQDMWWYLEISFRHNCKVMWCENSTEQKEHNIVNTILSSTTPNKK